MKDNLIGSLGGAKKLTTEYPLLYNMINSAKEIGNTDDFCDIIALGMNQESVYSKSVVSLSEKSPLILSYLEIWDDDRDILVCAFNRYAIGASLSVNDYDTFFDIEQVVKQKSKLRTKAIFVWSKQDGSSVTRTAECIRSNYYAGGEIVTGVKVTKPRASDGLKTKIAYNRASQMGNPDYSYPEAELKNGEVPIYCPFAGEATFSKDFTIVGVIEHTAIKDLKFQMSLFFQDQTHVDYNCYNSDHTFLSNFHIDAKTNKITWSFTDKNLGDAWEIIRDLSMFHVSTEIMFYCHFGVMLRFESAGAEEFQSATVTINSGSKSLSDSSTCIIEPIIIQWGCLAKGTKVLSYTGESIPVEKVRVGDRLASGDSCATVRDVITGFEREIIYIRTSSGKELQCTDTHVIKTARGYVRANKVTFGDKLITTDGTEAITDLYALDYNGQVFNFSFDQNSEITSNGIITGDFGMQNTPDLLKQKESQTPLAIEARKLFSELKLD